MGRIEIDIEANDPELDEKIEEAVDNEGPGGREVLVCDDATADRRVKDKIAEEVWSFRSSFLAGATGLDEDVFTGIMSNGKSESNNKAILALIQSTCGLDEFVDEAVGADGRGAFMSGYDGNEQEIKVDGTTYFVYRIN
jgi:hypothetical protein